MNTSYASYTIEDFIADDYFIQSVKHPTPDSEAYWANVIKEYPHLNENIHRAKLGVEQLSLAAKHEVPFHETPAIWSQIAEELEEPPKRIVEIVLNFWKPALAAASVIIALGLGWRWYQSTPKGKYDQLISAAKSPLEEVVNTTSTNLTVNMPDGSHAILKPESKLSYTKSFTGNIREVYLSGEAFFDVIKNPSKPFFVYANGLITKVLGTSFWVKAYEEDKQVTVLVKTGRVSVFAQKNTQNPDPETNGLVLTPNQQVVFGKADERLTRKLIERPVILLSPQELKQFSFTNASVTDIFAALEKAYGVDIVIDEELMANCTLTTTLSNETLFEKLDIICEALEATYKVVDAQVIITSKGCN